MSKKVLITGGAGFIGLHLANRLLDEGCQVHLVDNFSRGVNDIELTETLKRKQTTFENLNINNINDVERLDTNYDVIFHLAAIIGVAHVLERPYDVLSDNILMLVNMIDFARRQKKLSRFFFASTSEVYAGTLKYFELSIPTPESTPLAITDLSQQRTSYMLSKIYGEALCRQSGIPFTIFRPHNVYGARMGMSHVIPEQLKKTFEAKDNDMIDVFSVDHTRCFCFIDDAIEMLWRMMNSNDCKHKTLNLGTQNPEISMKELAKICHKVTEKILVINEMPASTGSPTRRCPDMSLTKRLINFQSQVDLHAGISLTYDWYRKNIFEGKKITAQ
jgi:UDP-glucose 4-epimerase